MIIPSSMSDLVARATAPDSQETSLWACEFITFAAATICFGMRMFSRKITGAPLWLDDYFAITCYIIDLVWLVLVPIWITNGLGRHIHEWHDASGQSIESALYMNKLLLYIAELFYAFALFFGKVAVLSFYWRMFKITGIKLPIQILAVCAVIWITVRTFMGIWHCVPVQAFWDPNAGGHCVINDSNFFMGTITVHVILDLFILSLPILQIRKLRLPTMQKLGVMAMFMFGIFICVAAVVIIVESVNFDAASVDLTWNLSPIVLWATVEVNLVTVSCCMPVLRPAFKFITTLGEMPSTHGNSASGPSNSKSYAMSKTGRSRRQKSMNKSRADMDGGDSTYELANSINDRNEGAFDQHAMDGNRTRVMVRGRGADTGGNASDVESAEPDRIHVKSETTVTHSTFG